MMATPIKATAMSRHSFLLALLLVFAVSVTLLAPVAEAKAPSEDEPTYDPNNEGMIEKGSRVSKRSRHSHMLSLSPSVLMLLHLLSLLLCSTFKDA